MFGGLVVASQTIAVTGIWTVNVFDVMSGFN